MNENNELMQWLLQSDEPWTQYNTRRHLLGQPEENAIVQQAHRSMLAHEQVQKLMQQAAAWGSTPLKRHNDASYPVYAFSTLADFGVRAADPGMQQVVTAILPHRSAQGVFQSVENIPKSFSGNGEDQWTWMICDAPVLLYCMAASEALSREELQPAIDHLLGLVDENGYRCVVDPQLGKFKGPGSRSSPCPVGNLFALKALSQFPELHDSPAVRQAAGMLLSHWASEPGTKYFLFGVGKKFRRLKAPLVWYDILHVAWALSHFDFVHHDERFVDMLQVIQSQANSDGSYTAGSMYMSWKGWSFSDKKNPSPWLTYLVLRIFQRSGFDVD